MNAEYPTAADDVKQNVVLDSLDAVELPSVEASLDVRITEAEALPTDEPSLLARALDDVTDLSLSEAKRILEMREDDPIYNKEQFGIIVRAKCSIINSAINASLRVS